MALADGTLLTWLKPADHVRHRGLWFSWKYINGVNYWEENKTSGLASGRTELLDVRLDSRNDFSAQIDMILQYRAAGIAMFDHPTNLRHPISWWISKMGPARNEHNYRASPLFRAPYTLPAGESLTL